MTFKLEQVAGGRGSWRRRAPAPAGKGPVAPCATATTTMSSGFLDRLLLHLLLLLFLVGPKGGGGEHHTFTDHLLVAHAWAERLVEQAV